MTKEEMERKGSKGLRDKNFKNFNGKKLLSYPLDLAKSLGIIDKIIFTSDSKKYNKFVRKKYKFLNPYTAPHPSGKKFSGNKP